MNRKIKPLALALFILLAVTLPLAFLPPPAQAATAITNCTELQNIHNNLAGDYYSHSEKSVQITSSKHQISNNIKYQNSNVQNKHSGFEF